MMSKTGNFSGKGLVDLPKELLSNSDQFKELSLSRNNLVTLSPKIELLSRLTTLDLSNNQLMKLPNELIKLQFLQFLNCSNNALTSNSLPKDFGLLDGLRDVNFSGNRFTFFPPQLLELSFLTFLHLGGNMLETVPSEIGNKLERLEVLYLGGNYLTQLPHQLGNLRNLTSLALAGNRLKSIPRSLMNLSRLQSLSLHNNQLETLPLEILALNVQELSLRNNPLVVRFVHDMRFEVPSLLELSGRALKSNNVHYRHYNLPWSLVKYLDTAKRCVNPHCKGVYFTSCVEHVKFIDFCGKYRLPLLQYLCSPQCIETPRVFRHSDSEDSDEDEAYSRMRRVLLG